MMSKTFIAQPLPLTPFPLASSHLPIYVCCFHCPYSGLARSEKMCHVARVSSYLLVFPLQYSLLDESLFKVPVRLVVNMDGRPLPACTDNNADRIQQDLCLCQSKLP